MFNKLGNFISGIFKAHTVTNEAMETLEDTLLTADISFEIVDEILQEIKKTKIDKNSNNVDSKIKDILKEKFISILKPCETTIDFNNKPFSIAMVGVNGCGKTSVIGKLVNLWNDKNIAVVACDTYRLAAIEQLKELTNKENVLFIAKENTDPSGLAYDGYNIAKSKNMDIVFFDTSGRLGNNTNLMNEIKKTIKTINKIDNSAPSKTILVLDGNGGQNSILQFEKFSEYLNIDGIIVTKTEGTAKSGFVITIAAKYKIPIFFTTFGEKLTDIGIFNSEKFVNNILI